MMIIYNIILLFELFWLKNLMYYIYLSISIFGIVYLLSPIIPFVYILLKKINQKRIKIFRIYSIIFSCLVIITGLTFTFVLIWNAFESSDFCRECPFNLDNSYINILFDNYINNNLKDNELKRECKNRRCLFNDNFLDNEYPYEYICNYEPYNEFDTIKNNSNTNDTINQIICQKIEKDYTNNFIFEKQEINEYLEMCNSFTEFHICQRITKPKKYYLKENFICPKKNYLTILVFLCLLSISINLILGFMPWKIEYNKFKTLIQRIRENRAGSKSLNSTQNISKIKKGEIESSFKKEPTEIIIVYHETNQDLANQTNKNDNSFDINTAEINNKDNESKINNNNNIQIQIQPKNQTKNQSIILNNNFLKKISNKTVNEKELHNEKCKKGDTNANAIKLFKKNDSPQRKKENKKVKENIKEEDKFISNSYTVSYYSDRNILEESKNVYQ